MRPRAASSARASLAGAEASKPCQADGRQGRRRRRTRWRVRAGGGPRRGARAGRPAAAPRRPRSGRGRGCRGRAPPAARPGRRARTGAVRRPPSGARPGHRRPATIPNAAGAAPDRTSLTRGDRGGGRHPPPGRWNSHEAALWPPPNGCSPWQKALAVPRVPAVAAQAAVCHRPRMIDGFASPGRAARPDDIRRAAHAIAPHIRATPLLRLAGTDLGLAGDVVLKLELLQASGSFKPRGAFNTILSARERHLPPAGRDRRLGRQPWRGGRLCGAGAWECRRRSSCRRSPGRPSGRGSRAMARGWWSAARPTTRRGRPARRGRPRAGRCRCMPMTRPRCWRARARWRWNSPTDAPELTHVLVATGGGGLIGGMAAWYAGSGVQLVSVEPEGCPTPGDGAARGPAGAGAGRRAGGRQPGRAAGRRADVPGGPAACGGGGAGAGRRDPRGAAAAVGGGAGGRGAGRGDGAGGPALRRLGAAGRGRRWACWSAAAIASRAASA